MSQGGAGAQDAPAAMCQGGTAAGALANGSRSELDRRDGREGKQRGPPAEDPGQIDGRQPHRVAAQGDTRHLPLPTIGANRCDITMVEPALAFLELGQLTGPIQAHAFDHGAHHNPALAGMFKRGEWAAVEVEAAQGPRSSP